MRESPRFSVFSMAQPREKIEKYLMDKMNSIVIHLLKLYFYRDTMARGKWKMDIYAFCNRIYLLKGKNRYPMKEFIYFYIWKSYADAYLKTYDSWINDVITFLTEDDKNVYIDISVIANNYRREETYHFINDYMLWLAEKLSVKGSVEATEVRSELDKLLSKYPFVPD